MAPHSRIPKRVDDVPFSERYFGAFQYSRHALKLVWSTSWQLTVVLGVLTIVAGILPAATAYVGKLIVDQVLLAAEVGTSEAMNLAFVYVAIEAGLVIVLAAAQRGLSVTAVAATCASGASRERDDPRKGAHARPYSVRGL